MPRRRSGPETNNKERVSVLYDILKKVGRRGIFLRLLRTRANDVLAGHNEIKSHSHLDYLIYGWKKGAIHVGGYLADIVEPVPEMPKNANHIRLKKGVRKRDLMQSFRR